MGLHAIYEKQNWYKYSKASLWFQQWMCNLGVRKKAEGTNIPWESTVLGLKVVNILDITMPDSWEISVF